MNFKDVGASDSNHIPFQSAYLSCTEERYILENNSRLL